MVTDANDYYWFGMRYHELCTHTHTHTPPAPRLLPASLFFSSRHSLAVLEAYLEMNGRFFGGRQIAASFYKEDKFDGLDLEPQPDEEKA